jgi:hypothetical protein
LQPSRFHAVVADTLDAQGHRRAQPIVIRDFENATIGFNGHELVLFEAGELLAKENGKDLKLKMCAKTGDEAATVVLMNQSVNDWGDGDGDGEAEWWPTIEVKPLVK